MGVELWGGAGGASRDWNMGAELWGDCECNSRLKYGAELHAETENATQDRNMVAELHAETENATQDRNMAAELHAETANATQG